MRLRALLILTLSLAVVACSHKQPSSPWTNAHWGMMSSEVMTAVPDLVPDNGSHLANGAAAQLRTERATVADVTLPAQFFFLDGRLVQIMFGDSQYHDNAATEKSLDHLAAALRKQYGQETVGTAMDPAAGLSRDYTWTSGDTEIVLSASPVTGTTSMYSVIYRRAAGK